MTSEMCSKVLNSGVTSYLYDSMGSRVSKTSANLSWTEYVDFGGNVIVERSTLALNSAMLSGSGFANGDFYTGAIAIIDSLKTGSKFGELTVKPNGVIMDGNTRIKVLEERGVNVNTLERIILEIPKEPIP
jgi:hypothetical protein